MADYARSEAKSFAKESLRGIFSAICLPERDGEVDEAGLRSDVEYCIEMIGAGGLYIHGFYGNFWLLTTAERQRVIEVVVDETQGRVPVICRCAHASLRETIGLMQHAERAGADLISLMAPWGGQADEDMVVRYFELAAAETTLGISVFNTPQAGYVMSPTLIGRLAEIENIAAIKNHMPLEHTDEVRALLGDRIVVVDPEEENFLISLLQHGQKAIFTGTNMMFDSPQATPMKAYVEAALNGDHKLATELYEQMQPIRDLHHRWVIEPWIRTGLCPISTVKTWTGHLGMKGGPVRPPLAELSSNAKETLVADLDAVGLSSVAASAAR